MFMDSVGIISRLPGLYWVLGSFLLPVPFFIQGAMETTYGVGWAKDFWDKGDKFTSIITCVFALLLVLLFFFSFFWIIPNMCWKIYKAKIHALADSRSQLTTRMASSSK
jgi:hypothetical protein